MNGAIVAVVGIEAKELEPGFTSAHAGIEEDCGNIELSKQLCFDLAYSQKGVERLDVGHE